MVAWAIWSFFCTLCGDLRKKYGDWAVVTGGSSGIGKAVVRKLAAQGINVFIVALDDDLLWPAHEELQKEFPTVQLRGVPVDLGSNPEAYMGAVAAATQDVPVSILINNAGFLIMDFFERRPVEQHMANMECNAGAAIRLSHYFYKRMVDQGVRGCIAFTSSASGFMPSPFASIYGATKSLLSHFATSLAVEASIHGIDVTVFNPSYTHSNLYAGAPELDILKTLSKFGWTPDDVATAMMKTVGRTVVRDLGAYAIASNLLGRYLDSGFLTQTTMPFVESMAPAGSLPDKNGRKKAN